MAPPTDADIGQILQSMKTLVQQMDPAAADAPQNIKDAELRRFLQAKDFDVRKAAKLFVKHLSWKRSYLPLGFIPEAEITTELQRKQFFLQGHDKRGCSILVMVSARIPARERNLEKSKRMFIYAFEKAILRSNEQGQDKFLLIVDLQEWTLKNMGSGGQLAMMDLIQNQYPECVRKMILVHAPSFFLRAQKAIYPFMDKTTKEKLFLLQDQNLQETLLLDINKDQLPQKYGGDMELVPVQDSRTAT